MKMVLSRTQICVLLMALPALITQFPVIPISTGISQSHYVSVFLSSTAQCSVAFSHTSCITFSLSHSLKLIRTVGHCLFVFLFLTFQILFRITLSASSYLFNVTEFYLRGHVVFILFVAQFVCVDWVSSQLLWTHVPENLLDVGLDKPIRSCYNLIMFLKMFDTQMWIQRCLHLHP